MSLDSFFRVGNISASGLTGERLRMELIANNIANAQTTRTPEGGPFRRQEAIFETVLNQTVQGNPILGGVRVADVVPDTGPLPLVYNPGHPDANREGFLAMPNVVVPLEMVNLITSTRAYEANLKVLQTFRQQLEQALTLLRS